VIRRHIKTVTHLHQSLTSNIQKEKHYGYNHHDHECSRRRNPHPNAHVAGTPTYFPSLTDPSKSRCLVTVIKNRGKNAQNQDLRDEFTLVFWGKYAGTAAIFLDTGRCISVEGVARPYTTDTGTVRADGKRNLNRITNIHVRHMEFGADTKKEMIARVTNNIALAKSQGLLDPNATITAEFLLNITRPAMHDYNPAQAEQTGLYGNAKVFIKGRGFIGETAPVITTPPLTAVAGAVPVAAEVVAGTEEIASLESRLEGLQNVGPIVPAEIAPFKVD